MQTLGRKSFVASRLRTAPKDASLQYETQQLFVRYCLWVRLNGHNGGFNVAKKPLNLP